MISSTMGQWLIPHACQRKANNKKDHMEVLTWIVDLEENVAAHGSHVHMAFRPSRRLPPCHAFEPEAVVLCLASDSTEACIMRQAERQLEKSEESMGWGSHVATFISGKVTEACSSH